MNHHSQNKRNSFGRRSDAGSAVAIVMLILAVVSILAMGLLVRSNMDTRFSVAYKSHERVFSLADGAAGIAYAWIMKYGTEVGEYDEKTGKGVSLPLYADSTEPFPSGDARNSYRNFFHVRKPHPDHGSLPESSTIATDPDKNKGMYWPARIFVEHDSAPPGEDMSEVYTQRWIAVGVATTERDQNLNPSSPKGQETPRSQTSVQIAFEQYVNR